MRFTERELTLALEGVAKAVLTAQDRSVRKGRRTADDAWAELTRFHRFQLLDGLGDQILPVLVSLPDVEVPIGERPSFTDEQVRAAIEERMEAGSGLRRKALLVARVALIRVALESVPLRQDPDALIVWDHL